MLSKKADLFILVSTDGEEGWGWEVVLAKWRQKRFLAQGMMLNQDGVYILFFFIVCFGFVTLVIQRGSSTVNLLPVILLEVVLDINIISPNFC